jgi:hypothetical protein
MTSGYLEIFCFSYHGRFLVVKFPYLFALCNITIIILEVFNLNSILITDL